MLSLDQASAIVDAALRHGDALGCAPLTVAVLDPGGHLLALKHQDGSGILRPQIAQAKAWGALDMGAGSRELFERAGAAAGFIAALTSVSNGRLVPAPGGVLIAMPTAASASAATTPTGTRPARYSPSNTVASSPTRARATTSQLGDRAATTTGDIRRIMTQVRTEQGVVEGTHKQGVFRFRGVPFAAAPVGNLRWAAPRPPASWNGVRDATAFGNAAIQTVDTGADLAARQSEDCLYLNIWSSTLDPAARQPVMVWIHGGGFINGAGSMPECHGTCLAQRGVTYVSFNYRLGAFGFLRHPEVGGNFAVQDWVAALEWVSRNITAFGGDPDNITIFGQSAGATAVRTLLATPSAQGLFHRAILQSAGFERPAALPSSERERVLTASVRLFEQVGGSDIEHLRQVPLEQVRQVSRELSGTRPPTGQVHTPAQLIWCPTEDGQVVAEDLSCWQAGVPVLFGHTANEARYFITPRGPYGTPPGTVDPAAIYTPATLATMASVLGNDLAGTILPTLTGSPYEALAELITTAIWTEPALTSYRRFTALGRTSYAYRFDHVSPGNRRTGMLAFHCSELPYLFGRLIPAADYDAMDTQISDTIAHAWTQFARTGTPTSPDGTPWPAATSTAPQLTVIDDKTHSCPLDVSAATELFNSLRVGGSL